MYHNFYAKNMSCKKLFSIPADTKTLQRRRKNVFSFGFKDVFQETS